jgi:hypothetical protein
MAVGAITSNTAVNVGTADDFTLIAVALAYCIDPELRR